MTTRLQKAVAMGVPEHPYSELCVCPTCRETRGEHPGDAPLFHSGESGSTPTPSLQLYEGRKLNPKEVRFETISENEAKNFIVPRHYLPRWFVGGSLFFGALAPDRRLIGVCALSAPMARSASYTPKNSLEIRRFFMEDVCEKNSESRMLGFIHRWCEKHLPHILYIITFGDPRYGWQETAFKAAGYVPYRAKIGADWSSHKSHKSREAVSDKVRWVKTIWSRQ